MDFLRPTILITIAILFLGCASGPNIAKKEDSSEALQIVTSAGAYGIFRDKTVPKDEVGDVGLAGYVGSTLMGLSLGSAQTGFAIALMADSTFGWEYENYVMYLDANEVKGKDKYQVCELVIENMAKTMPNDLQTLQAFSKAPLTEADKFTESQYNGGAYQCVDGYKLSDREDSLSEVYFNRDEFLVGTNVIVRSVSEPIYTLKFNDDLRSKMPSDNVVAVRYFYDSSHIANKLFTNKIKDKFANPDGFYSSPSITLPPATFLSLPRKQYSSDELYLKMVSMVRDNENAYLFIKPEPGSPQSIPLDDYHREIVNAYEKILTSK
ncbi:hypothetical protein Vca1114GL_00931 [Vibrio campbellii]|uniref:hypothetical protein n=1 Tax=Vibrio campbellii TaxID=680 RepID=UPI00097FBCD6|nr:hypothetical protein [Vibrio campbellii]AQM67452.1 hypothetical protein Vca1114GL_00931 [Vibrio campbellii]